MIIETKFKPGDTVFLIAHDKLYSGTVERLTVTADKSGYSEAMCHLMLSDGAQEQRVEDDLFFTKESLIETLRAEGEGE